ncbi:hypothetical protein KEJ20_00010 [Candidatus Bathyarchaeota archaeon]|nr:hypothetical protein [Candidatus Bathyarchaeota archaeon]
MLGNDVRTYLTRRDMPTPVAAFEVLHRKVAGAIMITASHNPPEWNGIKYIPEYAGPALPETTEEITNNISRIFRKRKIKEIFYFSNSSKSRFGRNSTLVNETSGISITHQV